jgi:acetate kinase
LDTLVFAGGIGENAPLIRSRICADLQCIGLQLDDERNSQNAALISAGSGKVAVRVIPTDEEIMIARLSLRVLGCQAKQEH